MNWYKQAIELLISGGIDYEKTCQQLAMHHPKILCSMSVKAGGRHFIDECRDLVKSGRKIEAIKLWRDNTGAGLKEAKDAVESLL